MKRSFPVKQLLRAVVACIAASQLAHAADWPQWRGPRRDGVAVDSRLPTAWPAAPPAPRWRASVGEGYSSPVVADGRVFILARPAEGQEAGYAFDARTGRQLWRVTWPNTFHAPDPRAGRGPNSTATVDGDRVYMLGLGGMFHCLDVKTGRVLWKHDFAAEYWGVERDESGDDRWFPPCGTAASPLALENRVVVPVGGPKAGAFAAFDRRTGALAWKALEDRSSYGSPMLAGMAGVRQIVGFTGKRMVGIDPEKQALLWEYPFPAMFEQTMLTPVVWKDSVVIGGEGKPTVAYRLRKEGDHVAGEVAWQNADLRTYMITPVVLKDHLIGLSHMSRSLVCIDLATGVTAWQSPRFSDYASLVLAGDRLLALTNKGELLVAKADTGAYTPLSTWKVSEAGGTWAHPAVAGSQLFIKDQEHLACYELGAARLRARPRHRPRPTRRRGSGTR